MPDFTSPGVLYFNVIRYDVIRKVWYASSQLSHRIRQDL